ncbi:M23 family peptidase [Agromyces badenianii]|uniref:M23 family peptidase n=1 Tax=Agromyces badenianii TaxID=2080742 RepID=A0A2S0WWN2_9MICO|nr:M23 family peptidase [Agromyces badenianii]
MAAIVIAIAPASATVAHGSAAAGGEAVGMVGATEAIEAIEAIDGAKASRAVGPNAEPWRWPVPAPIRVVAPFRAPPTPYTAGHRGIDIAVTPAATVAAPASGAISFAGMVAGRPVVAIDHGDGVVSAIEPVAALARIEAGMRVTAGEAIGTVSTGGHCEADCVHFGVRVDGEYVSPFLFLGGLPRAVLLPSN